MSASELDDLLSELSGFPAGTSLSQALQAMRPQRRPGEAEAIKQCALVRWFDQSLYDSLCKGLKNKPEFEEFITCAEVGRLRSDRWSIKDGERARLLKEWQANPSKWKRRNTDIGFHFAAGEDPEAQLAAVYHLAASTSPERVMPLFQKWFSRADKAFDMAQCNALLEMLRLQVDWRGKKVSELWRESSQYYAARVLFLDDYYKSGSYFERRELLKNFTSVLERKRGDGVWIFHLHATGGTGKSMFLRWLTARRLVPSRILCARLDFDDFRLDQILNFPLQLFRRMVEQFTQQPQGNTLTSLLERLRREEGQPGWNSHVMEEIQRQLRGARITTPIVVMLDTLEEATLSAASWLERCVGSLRVIHDVCPNLTVVLSGRYDIATRSSALRPGEFLSYELPRFSEAEAHRYLEKRGIPSGKVRDAIVERTEADEDPAEKAGASDNALTGRNPFKLAMFAELALNRSKLTADEVRRFPRVDIAYLIERVIRRIDAQPIRWMIRYGVIARHLTLEFAEAVLLPPLLEALRGQQTDDPRKGLEGFKSLDLEKTDVWTSDLKSVAELEQNGMKGLWDQLSAYARDRGWLTSVVVDGQSELHFHPEVINPTRELLREQDIFAELQDRAANFFEQKARSEKQAAIAVRCLRDAIFHRFQADGTEARKFWIGKVHESADRFGPAAAVPVAAEILGREYAEAERIAYPRISSPELLICAHCEAAELLMQAAGLVFAEPISRNEFNRHIELALEIVGDDAGLHRGIPTYLEQIFRAWQFGSPGETAAYLRAAIPTATDARQKFLLEFQLYQIMLLHRSPETPIHLREALRLLPDAGRVGVVATDLYLALAAHYTFEGAHTAVIEALNSAARSAQEPRARARVLNHEAWYAVGVGDISTAEKRMIEMRRLPVETLPSVTSPQVLEGRLAIADLDPFTALRACEQGLASSTTESERARCLDQRGEARALLFGFRAALNDWDSAAGKYDLAAISAGPARCALLSAMLKARVMGDYRDAEARIASALSLRGSADIEIRTELNLLLAFVLCRTHRRERARELLTELIQRADIPPQIHARVLMFALVFGLQEPTDEFLEDVRDTIGQIQPISRTAEVLEWIEYADGGIDVPPSFVMRLIGQFARPGSELSRGIELLIRRADLYRVFGRFEAAGKELDRASAGGLEESTTEFKGADESSLLKAWRLNLARKRLGQSATRFGSLLKRAQSTRLAATPLYGAIVCEVADEAFRSGDIPAARELLEAYRPPSDEPPNIWQARRLDLLAKLASPSDRDRLHRQAADQYRALGQSAPPNALELDAGLGLESLSTREKALTFGKSRATNAVTISEADLPPALGKAVSSHESTIDFLSANWSAFAGELREVLRSRKAKDAPIRVSKGVSALPWELGGALCRQSSNPPGPALPPEDRLRPRAVQLLMPASSEDDVSFAGASGGRLEDVYYGNDIRPAVMHVSNVKDLYKTMVSNQPPVLVHIVAAVREGSGGAYLDFASTSHRLESMEAGSSYGEAGLATASLLSSLLGSLPRPPFVILDITHPHNSAEAVRMLLLRNIFATELFDFGKTRGILGCGLALPGERLALSAVVVDALLADRVTAPIRGLRAAATPDDLDHILPRQGAALWTNDPEDRLFVP